MRSRIIFTVWFSLFGTLFVFLCWHADTHVWNLVFAYIAVPHILLAVAYGFNRSNIFLKTKTGRFRVLSWLLFFPYLLPNYIAFRLYCVLGKEPACNKIFDNIYLGRRLKGNEMSLVERHGIRRVLDLTTEFPEPPFMRAMPDYLCLPVLDTLAPSLDMLHKGVDWLLQKDTQLPTYVHCAFGHGRSAVYILALMIKKSPESTVEEALSLVQTIRPRVQLKKGQLDILVKYRASLQNRCGP